MDIAKLKNKRQKNVREQNAITKHFMLQGAKYWKDNKISQGLELLFQEKGVDINSSILIEYDRDYPGIPTDTGIIVTKDKRFFEFAVDLSEDRLTIIDIDTWNDITTTIEIDRHKPGIGKTKGFIALEVLHELTNY